METLTVDTLNVGRTIHSSPSTTSSNSSSPSPIAESDTTRPSFSRQSSQTYTLATASTSSLPTPTVKFAPLPTISPRKRRCNQPLGMAARAQLVQKRRGRLGENGELVITASPMWTSAELEEQRMRIEAMAARYAEFQARENAREVSRHCNDVDVEEPETRRETFEGDEGVDDPLLVIGKIVKVAGKTLWRRMSRSKDSVARRVPERRRDLSPLPILKKSLSLECVAPTEEPEPLQLAGSEAVGEKNESDDRPIIADIGLSEPIDLVSLLDDELRSALNTPLPD